MCYVQSKQENLPPSSRPSVLERLGAAPTKVLNNLQPSAVVQQEEKVLPAMRVRNFVFFFVVCLLTC
jgi:hypothetical protein